MCAFLIEITGIRSLW